MRRILFPVVAALAALFADRATATPVINEIMYHSATVPEDVTQEWIEIYNNSAASTFDLGGWQFTNGVSFTFPVGTSLAPGGYLVVAANVASFQAAHPGFAGQLVGGWTGKLSDSGEHLVLSDAAGVTVDEVHYSNAGEWGIRGRGPLVLSHRGWEWFTDADGGGKTIELRNPALAAFDCGQNWGVSAAVGGTPGAANSVASADVAPLIKDVKHQPEIPHSTDPIVVSCNLHDEGSNAVATLFWRLDGAGSFNALPMSDTDGSGDVEATIPAQANLAIVEYYVSATDGTNTRTWPAPARTSDIGVLPETFAQATNALVLVDNSFDANAQFQAQGSQPIYRLIMTAAEKAELLQIQTNAAQDLSDAAMNATFISHDGTGVKVHYLSAIRNRGTSSRLGPPNNYNVGFRNDDLWEDRGSLQINCRYPHSQVLGALCFDLAGIAPQESAVVRIRVNGVDLAETGLRMYGRYVRNETMSTEWAKRHYPTDPDGNIYFLDDHNPGPVGTPSGNLGSGEFRYEGTNPLAYSDTYLKKTNQEFNDYSDLVTLTDKLTNTPDAIYVATIQQYLDLDQFYTFIATDALIGNQEGGLQSGRADDVGLYRGVVDTRFKLIPHDFDSVFAFGLGTQDPGPNSTAAVGDPYARSIFSYDGEAPTSGADGVLGLHKLFSHPELVPRYYTKLLEQMNNWFNHTTLDPIIDRVLGGWVAPTGTNVSVASAKAFIDTRRTNVLAQIQQNYAFTATGNAADVNGMKQTTDGSATFSGTFNVAQALSVTVNSSLATIFQRKSGTDAAGTWKFVAAAGSGFLKPGINRVTANFYDGLNGAGNLLKTLFVDVYYSGGAQTGIAANGVPQVGSVGIIAPDSYVPGVPVMVRVDLRNSLGAYDRTAWNTTATLTATNGVTLTPNTVTLYNGVGSALVTAGSSGGGGTQTLFSYGTGGTGTTTVSGTGGSVWKTKTDFTPTTLASFITSSGTTWKNEGFDDSTWVTLTTQTGYGDGDENQTFTEVDYDSVAANTQAGPVYLFRNTFSIADVNALASVTGEVKYDDGAIVYVNGTEILRTADLVGKNALTDYADVTGTNENTTSALTIPLNLLHNGVNTIAVEVHQHDNASTDVTFDLKLQANLATSNPGNFTLTATANGLSNAKALTSLGGVAQTSVSGALAGSNTWSGIVHVTGDVTVPVGATLTINPGTHVLIDGTATAGDTTGKKITIAGTLNAPGTLSSPISITSFDPNARWGGFVYNAAQPSTLDFCLISHAAHTATLGHTNKGPIFNITGSNVTLHDCVWGESPGKAMFTSGTTNITIQRSLITHTITGPELQDGTSLLCEDTNIQEVLPNYRESNDAVPDDEDCLYIHNAPARSVLVNRCVFAKCGDDTIDCLAGPLTVQDSILRQAWDKGVSLLNNDLTILRTQIIDCDKGIALKANAATTQTVTADHITVSSEEHNTADTVLGPWGYPIPAAVGDPDAPATGIWTQNKAGQSNTSAVLRYIVSNSIIEGKIPINVDAPYPAANTTPVYTCTHDTDTAGAVAWPGTGNIEAVPLFVDGANKDFHLQTGSPCKNTGNPAAPLDADGSRTDMGALPFGGAGVGTLTNIVWAAANSPFHITSDVTIATGSTLTIEPGVTVYTDENHHILVNGSVHIVGDANHHITLSGVPGLPLKADPADPGLPLTTPKWGGIWLENSNDPNNLISYVDFVDAQDTLAASIAVNRGCIELKESACTVDHCTFRGTHLHMIYGDHCSITCQYCDFPNEFPGTDLPGALNNVAEPFKLTNKFLPGGHCLVRWNTFHGNKGHNDVLDVDSDVIPNPILQLRENLFLGQSGDEDCDLGGDVLIDGNFFAHGHKDTANNSTGHASAFSTGDAGTGTTVVCSRNIFWDVDHATTLKAGTATIFEHNTNYALHANFTDVNNNTDVAGTISFVVPAEGTPPGDGAYCGENIFWTIPSVFGGADIGTGGSGTFPTRLQFDLNMVDPAAPTAVGSLHPGGLYSLGTGNLVTNPKLADPANGNFALAADSPARGAGFFGNDLGALVSAGAMITGEPPAQTPSTSATLIVGGPDVFYYKWKLDGGAWSAPIAIDPANPLKFPRTGPTHRTAQLALSGLSSGPHTVYVVGQDFGGQWQDDAAATVSKTWTVNTALQLVQINEVLADSATLPDTIELYNAGANAVNIGGWSLSDDPQTPNKYVIPANTMLAAGGYYTVTATTSLINLDKDGDSVYLHNGAALVDSVTFGHQIPDFSIGRTGQDGAWALCQPTFGAANVKQRLGIANSVRINEWFTSGDVLYDNDWIELANSGPLPVLLAGLNLTDNPAGNPSVAVLPPLSFIAANGFVKLIADGHPELGATHLNFSLDEQQEEISLLTATGTQLDHVIFYQQTTDYSQGRDASGNLVYYELPTAGLANGTGDPAYANALALLHGLRITEIMYNAIGGDLFDYVELRNVGATTLQLGGVKFVEGIDFTFPAMSLVPGQNVIVCKDVTKFRARYGNGPNVAGAYSGKLDNGGEIIGLQLPPPFDANILTFGYSDGWYASTDGLGTSLVIFDPLAKSNTWGNRSAWRASGENGGNPDGFTARADTYSGWSALHRVLSVTADDDKDGVPALVEYALGMDPADTNDGEGALGAPFVTVNASGHAQLHFLVPVTAAPQGHGMAEAVYNVQASSDLATWTTIATKTFTTSWTGTVSVGAPSGGFVPVIAEDANAVPRRYLRLQVIWAP